MGMTNTPQPTWTAQRKAKARRRAQQVEDSKAAAKEQRKIEDILRRNACGLRISEGTIRWVMESGYTRQDAEVMARRAERFGAAT